MKTGLTHGTDGDFAISVSWNDGTINFYRKQDLELVAAKTIKQTKMKPNKMRVAAIEATVNKLMVPNNKWTSLEVKNELSSMSFDGFIR